MADWPSAVWVDATPTTGSTVNITVGDARVPVRLCVNNTGLLAALTFSWPITGVLDGQVVAINCQSIVTLIAHTPSANVRGGLSSAVAGGNGIYVFRAATSTWYKFDN